MNSKKWGLILVVVLINVALILFGAYLIHLDLGMRAAERPRYDLADVEWSLLFYRPTYADTSQEIPQIGAWSLDFLHICIVTSVLIDLYVGIRSRYSKRVKSEGFIS